MTKYRACKPGAGWLEVPGAETVHAWDEDRDHLSNRHAGRPWGAAERSTWQSRQTPKRSYDADVLRAVDLLRARYDVVEYGRLNYPPDDYPLFAIQSRSWRDELPCALVTGGVHGYETSGVHGALQLLEQRGADYEGRINLVVAPCVSPWAYERIHRWNINAIDPNRSFREDSPAEEAAALMRLVH